LNTVILQINPRHHNGSSNNNKRIHKIMAGRKSRSLFSLALFLASVPCQSIYSIQAHLTKPRFKKTLQLEESMGGTRTALQGSPEEMRAQFSGLMTAIAPLYPPPSDAVTTKDYDLGGFCIRTYSKKGGEGNRQAIGIYNHGGGYVLGSVDSEDAFCRMVVEHLDTVMVSIGYRLAPEAKAPAQLEDGLTGLKWVLNSALINAQCCKGSR
jgi:acetyl esterase/lipase